MKNRPIAYGIIGGIGSGKSVVCRIFSILGVPVFDSDKEAKQLIQFNAEVKNALIDLLGKEIYDFQGNYLTEIVKQKINEDNQLLTKINQIVHPAVRFAAEDFFNKNQNSSLTLYESALIHKNNKPDFIQGLIAVKTPLSERLEYLKKRNKWDEETIQIWIKRQLSEEFYLDGADYIIENSKNNFLIPQCLNIYQILGGKNFK